MAMNITEQEKSSLDELFKTIEQRHSLRHALFHPKASSEKTVFSELKESIVSFFSKLFSTQK
jgi:calcineurin-like phosphoesterase